MIPHDSGFVCILYLYSINKIFANFALALDLDEVSEDP